MLKAISIKHSAYLKKHDTINTQGITDTKTSLHHITNSIYSDKVTDTKRKTKQKTIHHNTSENKGKLAEAEK
jgi:hypothetical protein